MSKLKFGIITINAKTENIKQGYATAVWLENISRTTNDQELCQRGG